MYLEQTLLRYVGNLYMQAGETSTSTALPLKTEA